MLRPFVRELVELDDEGLCCGAGGAYSIFEPELAGQIRDRQVAAIDRVTPDVVASANPGCSMHLGAVGVPTEASVSAGLMFQVLQIVCSLPGVFLWFGERSRPDTSIGETPPEPAARS